MVKDLKEAAEVSMGTEITIIDIVSIKALADQVSHRGFAAIVVEDGIPLSCPRGGIRSAGVWLVFTGCTATASARLLSPRFFCLNTLARLGFILFGEARHSSSQLLIFACRCTCDARFFVSFSHTSRCWESRKSARPHSSHHAWVGVGLICAVALPTP